MLDSICRFAGSIVSYLERIKKYAFWSCHFFGRVFCKWERFTVIQKKSIFALQKKSGFDVIL